MTLILLWFLLYVAGTGCLFLEEKQKVLLLLVDGLRYDQFGLDLPSLQRLEYGGVKADWLDTVFLTYTMPNMYSLATGLYPESHGVVHNYYFNSTTRTLNVDYDDVMNITEYFDTGVEPLWVSARLAGKKVACFMWAGTSVPVKGVKCNRVIYYNLWNAENYLPKDRVKDALMWIAEEDFDLVLLALEVPDVALHKSGISGDQLHPYLSEVDSILNYLLDDVDRRDLWETLNLIVVSDHGHTAIDPAKSIILTDYIDEEDIEFIVIVNSLFQMKTRDDVEHKVLQQLRSAHPALHVFKKEDFPERFHYGNHPRNLPIIGYVDIEWHVHVTVDASMSSLNASDHGYDNENMEMKGIFYARGPAFKSGHRAKPLESVDLYVMICDILGINAAPNNGSRQRFQDMMQMSTSRKYGFSFFLLPVAVLSVLMVYSSLSFILYRKKSQMGRQKGA